MALAVRTAAFVCIYARMSQIAEMTLSFYVTTRRAIDFPTIGIHVRLAYV